MSADTKSSLRIQLVTTASATLIYFIAGTCMGWPSPTLALLLLGEVEPHITSDESSWIASMMAIGSLVTPIPTGYIVDIIGRKYTLIIAAVPFMMSWVIVTAAKSAAVLYVARFFAGLGMGMAFTVGPMYTGEIAEDRIRGAVISFFQLMMNLGLMFEYCVGPYVSPTTLGGLSMVFPVLFLITFVWMPESPYYFLLKHRREDAVKSLMKLRGTSNPIAIENELIKMEDFVQMNQENSSGYRDLIFDKGGRKSLFIILGLILFQNLSGINAILSYSTRIFQMSHSSFDSSVSVMILGSVQVTLSLVSSVIVDLAGRRPMLILSCAGSAFALAVEGTYFYMPKSGLSTLDWLPVTAMVLYLIMFTLGLGGLPTTMMGELFSTSIKGFAMCISSFVLGISALVVVKLYQVAADALGIHVVLWAFSVCCLMGIPFVYFVVPETKGKTFMQIGNDLRY